MLLSVASGKQPLVMPSTHLKPVLPIHQLDAARQRSPLPSGLSWPTSPPPGAKNMFDSPVAAPVVPCRSNTTSTSTLVDHAGFDDSAVPNKGMEYDPYENRGPSSVSSVSSIGSLGSFHSLMRAIARDKASQASGSVRSGHSGGQSANGTKGSRGANGAGGSRTGNEGSHPAMNLLQTSMQPVVGNSMFHESFTARSQSPRANRYFDEQNIILERLMALAQKSTESSSTQAQGAAGGDATPSAPPTS